MATTTRIALLRAVLSLMWTPHAGDLGRMSAEVLRMRCPYKLKQTSVSEDLLAASESFDRQSEIDGLLVFR